MFDVYTGPQIGEGRKSLTLALRFRAADRTLTEDEASAARDAAVAAAAERLEQSSGPDPCDFPSRSRRKSPLNRLFWGYLRLLAEGIRNEVAPKCITMHNHRMSSAP